MAYIVQSVLTERGTGTYHGQLATLQAAMERANNLRRIGIKTVVLGPDGEPIGGALEQDDATPRKVDASGAPGGQFDCGEW